MPDTPSRSHQPLLAIDDVSRRFGRRTVVNRVTLTVEPGEIHLVVGPNGSGKSTLARLGVGLLRPHAGAVRVGGHDPRTVPSARGALGYLGHESQLYDDLTPAENLEFAARLLGVSHPGAAAATALGRFGVDPEGRVPVRRLSRGYVQRIALARSLVHRPALLVWDEPLTGLDAPTVEATVAVIEAERARGAAVMLISHDLPELWRLAAQVHVVRDGEIRLSADTGMTLEQFRTSYAGLLA